MPNGNSVVDAKKAIISPQDNVEWEKVKSHYALFYDGNHKGSGTMYAILCT